MAAILAESWAMRIGQVLGGAAVTSALAMTSLLYLGASRGPEPHVAATQTAAAITSARLSVDPLATSTVQVPKPTLTRQKATKSIVRTSVAPPRTTAPASTPPQQTATVVPTPTRPAPPAPRQLPLPGDPGSATQVLTVTAADWGSTRATLQAWNRVSGGWQPDGPAALTWVGYPGMTADAREGFDGTPVGNFAITETFGNWANPGTSMPYWVADANDWWDGDSQSSTYNSHQRCVPSACRFRTSET